MCDSTRCDDCNRNYCGVLHPIENSWKYVCTLCKEKRDNKEEN